MPHICVSELGHHWFMQWLVACSAPSQYLNQCWLIGNELLGTNFSEIIFIQENVPEYVVCKNGDHFAQRDELKPKDFSWWRHQMETFSPLLTICARNSSVNGEFPAQRPVTRSFDVFFDLGLNKRLCKQSWGWLFETLSRPLWRHCNVPHYGICTCTWGFSLVDHSCFSIIETYLPISSETHSYRNISNTVLSNLFRIW